MKLLDIKQLLNDTSYPGRGIILGRSADNTRAVIAYFIMGRSENSRNRVFTETEDGIRTEAYDPAKLSDPSLIIYHPVRVLDNGITIVTNGDQTDTIRDFMLEGHCYRHALLTREFEPDAPNLTPRISGMLTFGEGDFTYKMSILKSGDAQGTYCNRFTFDYNHATPGVGHFIHTYGGDGNPLPTFTGEPERVALDGFTRDIDRATTEVWNSLHPENRISLFVRYIELETGKETARIINKNM